MISGPKKIFIAELLKQNGLITQEQIEHAFKIQKDSDKKIGQILVDLGYVKEKTLLKLLSEQLGIPFIDVKDYDFDDDIVRLLPEFYARHFRAIVLQKEGDRLLVGMVDPQNLLAKDEIQRILKEKVEYALVSEQDLLSRLDALYRRTEEISQYAESLSEEITANELDIITDEEDITSEDLPVVNLLRTIFEDAAQMGASDIHIEPGEKILYIRLRIDGVLQEQTFKELDIIQALVQRVKLIANMNIAEKRLPQDGRFSFKTQNKVFDVRVSTLPTQYGESLVMRLLNQADRLLQLDQIGMPSPVLDYYKKIIQSTYGLILIVGPTGSGKTTTLYSTLNRLNCSEDKIITVEDPVEYRIDRINQIQVNNKIDLTFANVLRSILRQDPDIIMIGELRDKDTVNIGLRAALTGHLVLATLHTNETLSAPTRLLDMGAEGYILASVLRAVLAQRLVRQNCSNCLDDDTLNVRLRNWLRSYNCHPDAYNFKKGSGCNECNHTGFKGRLGVFELLPMTDELINAIRNNDTSKFRQIAEKMDLYKPLAYAGIDLAKEGRTTVAEVVHMAGIV